MIKMIGNVKDIKGINELVERLINENVNLKRDKILLEEKLDKLIEENEHLKQCFITPNSELECAEIGVEYKENTQQYNDFPNYDYSEWEAAYKSNYIDNGGFDNMLNTYGDK